MITMIHHVKETQELVNLVISWETEKVRLETPTGSDLVVKNEDGAGSLSAPVKLVREALPKLKNLKVEVLGAENL
jgi:hypothetical protein